MRECVPSQMTFNFVIQETDTRHNHATYILLNNKACGTLTAEIITRAIKNAASKLDGLNIHIVSPSPKMDEVLNGTRSITKLLIEYPLIREFNQSN